ncbi:hypothetical protein EMCRGX_G021912 [Ephydatia muelleri]
MALFGAVGEYVEGEEDWSQYVERLGHFFGANGLKELARKCEFGDALNDMLRDRLVCGINDERVQKRLLVEVNLTFDSALKISQGCEVAERCAKEIHSGRSQELAEHQNQQVHAVTPGRPQWRTGPGTGTPRCYRCLRRDHAPDKCPHRSAECFGCGKRGHIRRACKQVQAKAGGNAAISVSIDGVLVTMELDTGAAVSIVSESTFRRLWSGKVLERSGIRLCTYSGESLKVIGKWEADVKYNNQTDKLSVIVLEGAGPSLLGRDWLHRFRIDWKSLFVIQKGASLENVLTKYEMVFNEGLGTVLGYEAKLVMKENAVPRFCKARPMPYAIKEKIEKELNKLVQEGILKPVELSEWAAPIVPVVKPDQSIRICGDFRLTVNQALETERYPLPKIEDILASLAGGERFTKLDLSKAYLQVQLDEASRKFMVINTHKGLFQYTRMPFGVSSAPSIFQRIMDSVLQGIPKVMYIDDILITGSTDKERLETLEKVLYKLKEAGIHLNKDKCVFLQESVVYLGYKIDKNGIHPLAEKVEAVKNAPEPKNITELKSYLGLLTYYSRFLPRMATMLAQLYRLLQAKIPWNWTQKEKMAFENSKNLLLSAKVLVHFDPNKELILACDASSYGVGAVLSHKMSDGTERPIAFASRTLSSAEKNYSQLEKEGLACIFGVKRFHLYLYGRNFTIVTDHKPLLQLFDPQRGIPMQVSGRIQRWIMTLAVYKYKLVFKKTEEHGNADALSRLPMDGKQIEEEEVIPTELVLLFESLKDSPVDCSQVKHWTKKDPILSQVLQYILAGWPLHPPSGASQTLLSFWQRRMELSTHDGYKDIEMLVSKCPQCQAARPSPPVAPLQPWSWPTRPWARLHIDYAGPVEGQMLLVVIDAHSKWIEVEVGKDATAEATIQRLRTIFSRSAPHHPSSNGMAERAVQTVKQGVKKMTTGTLRDKQIMAAEDPELNNGAQDEQEEDANNSVAGDEPEIDEEIDQEARPPVIVQQAPDRRYPSRNRRHPERYQAGFS